MFDRSLIWAGIGALCGVLLTSQHYAQEIKKNAEDVAQYVSQVQQEREDYNKEIKSLKKQIGVIDAKYYAEAQEDKKTIADLRDCVESGNCGLQVAVECPPSAASGTGGNRGSGVDSRNAARLTANAQRNYFALLDNMSYQRKQLLACQAILKEVKNGQKQR